MARAKTVFICNVCGAPHSGWAGRCSECGSWNSLEQQTEIISGIDEKDNVVIKSTNGNTAKTTPTGFGMPMGNNMRMR